MTIFYSAKARGFYDDKIHTTVPADAVALTAEEYAVAHELQSTGKQLVPGSDGKPTAVDQVAEDVSIDVRMDMLARQSGFRSFVEATTYLLIKDVNHPKFKAAQSLLWWRDTLLDGSASVADRIERPE